MDSLITRAFIGGQSLANLDICGYDTLGATQSKDFPSNAKYGYIVAVGDIVINFPVWFKCGITGEIRVGYADGGGSGVAELRIETSSVKTTGQGVTVVWYG